MLAVGKVPSMNVDGARHVATLSYVQFEGPCEKTILLNSSKGPKRLFWQSAVVVHETFSRLHCLPHGETLKLLLHRVKGLGLKANSPPTSNFLKVQGPNFIEKTRTSTEPHESPIFLILSCLILSDLCSPLFGAHVRLQYP